MAKRILITGTKGYIGCALEKHFKDLGHDVKRLDVKSPTYLAQSFKSFDVVIHTAAIVHNNLKNASMLDYMNINYHLTRKIADKAKQDGVSQFIFFSTMNVFGLLGGVGYETIITKTTPTNPQTAYGISKGYAEDYLRQIETNRFKVSIVRPPMVYGKDAPGNFAKLEKIARLGSLFPNIHNHRSVIHIDNLTRFVETLVYEQASGIFHPQDFSYMSTTETIHDIRMLKGKQLKTFPVSKGLFKMMNKVPMLKKVYGNLVYSQNIDKPQDYRKGFIDFGDALKKTIR
ncbi:NAD-dependent epimerase/dehydratase family protein [Staphylococcus massiliensis]|uniref:Capsular polysaccharide synthesis enzyme n=1 Tax=Staphylococcus massiliensis S46 TaxID=1229783 RepID=K9ATS2_9STAP|nr:NAD-dependent epimerase/dehydratase family protein [Staphylococcus massiliensis]EKU45997.1 capsular polysaccharide synthesis enzyme [Staphylococcus massiliensis S46]PNZ97904.1 capsular biosynthesis protein [Staphylococcus massiliensis CCUG 55927]